MSIDSKNISKEMPIENFGVPAYCTFDYTRLGIGEGFSIAEHSINRDVISYITERAKTYGRELHALKFGDGYYRFICVAKIKKYVNVSEKVIELLNSEPENQFTTTQLRQRFGAHINPSLLQSLVNEGYIIREISSPKGRGRPTAYYQSIKFKNTIDE